MVFSEWALSHPDAWEYLRPILVENEGWALFIYTPRGRNHGHATYLRALEAESWFCEKLTVEDTGLITPAQIEEERRAGMSDGKIGQEFYCSFDADIDEQLISHDLVSAAMARQLTGEAWEEKVIGVDVARFGDDKSALFFRHGRDGTPRPYERYAGLDTMALAAKVAERIGTWDPDAVFVDEGGVGGGVVDRLHQLGHAPGDRRQLRRQGRSRRHRRRSPATSAARCGSRRGTGCSAGRCRRTSCSRPS